MHSLYDTHKKIPSIHTLSTPIALVTEKSPHSAPLRDPGHLGLQAALAMPRNLFTTWVRDRRRRTLCHLKGSFSLQLI